MEANMTLSDIWHNVREIIRNMVGLRATIENTLNIAPAVSHKMAEAIDEWTNMYEDKADWIHEPTASDPTRVVSLGLPAFIASEKARMAVLELQSEITAPKKTEEVDNPKYQPPTSDLMGNIHTSGEPMTIIQETPQSPEERAKYMNEQYQTKLLPKIRTQLEFGIAKGSLIIKPYVVKSKQQNVAGMENEQQGEAEDKYDIEFDFIQADCFYPFAFDSNGKLSEVAFIQTKTDKDKLYTRLEYHKLTGSNVTITNRVFENEANAVGANTGASVSLGREITLDAVPEWRNLPKSATIKNVDRLLFGYFKMPDANTIDPHSPLGISGFARAKSLIKDADLQYSRLLWEYEGGQLAIDIDRDALMEKQDGSGTTRSAMGQLQQRLYRTIDLGESNTYQPYAPQLRDASLINGLNNILMRIEDVVALSRGTMAEVATEARTATELKILKQRSYSSNLEIQKALEVALKDVIYAMDVYCTLYNIVDDVVLKSGKVDMSKLGLYDVSFTWDDSILVDVDTELNKRMTLLQAGLTSKREVRMWYFGETESQAQTALDKIKDENQQSIEQNMQFSSQMGKSVQQGQPSSSNNPSNEKEQPKVSSKEESAQ
jgi:A118 family predicted phage portal protein